MTKSGYKTLGDNVVPIHYELLFEPDFKSFTTSGSEKIKCMIKMPTKEIRLNAKQLEIKTAYVRCGNTRQKAEVRTNEKREEISLILSESAHDETEIEISFTCQNNDKLYGFYRSKYTVDGEERYILTSQFEAADARAAFPCFDEPAFKATFKVSMLIDTNLDAISNMPIKHESVSMGKKLVIFDQTPKMSSYLLYLGVGAFEYTKGKVGNVELRVVTVPGKKELTQLPLEYAERSLAWLQEYFGIDYPLPKLDLIAAPDFAVGAMENWGAITFRETSFLCNEKTPLANRQAYHGIADTITHEIVHQWFGDLVTMKWWDDIWLNESFATFMSTKALEALYPESKFGIQYVNEVIGLALSADALKNTHPINVKVNSVGEIDATFDRISYEKGGSVLYMLENFVGKETFRKGLHEYLSNNAYSNASKEQLWQSIEKAVKSAGENFDISKMTKEWVDKEGHPVVHVKKAADGFHLSQERYTLLKNSKDVWPIPISYNSSRGSGKIIMEKAAQNLKVKSKWLKLNYGQYGFYRVMYEDDLLEEIGEQIKSGKIGDVDAWGVENDLFSFARSGIIPISKYLDFVADYCMKSGYPTNASISIHLSSLYLIGYGRGFDKKVKEISIAFHKGLLENLGWKKNPADNVIKTGLRSAAIFNLGMMGDAHVIGRAVKEFNDMMHNGKEIEPNIRMSIYALAAWDGNADTFDIIIERYKNEKLTEEKRRLLRALGNFKNTKILIKSLAFNLSENVRLQDSYFIPSFISSNPVGKDLTWSWVKSNWRDFISRYPSGTHLLSAFTDIQSVVSERRTRNDIARFFAHRSNMRDDIRRSVYQTLERIDANIKMVKKNK